MDDRLSEFVQQLKKKKLDGFIVTNPINIFYLSGFRGVSPAEREAVLIISPRRATLITARLYQHEARKLALKSLSVKITAERDQIPTLIQKILKNAQKVGFEENDLRFGEYQEFKRVLTKSIPFKNLIEDLRIIKSEEEITRIEKAQIISQRAFWALVKTIKIGQTETEIAQKLATIIKDLGGHGLAFESIVACGSNSSRPHYVTGNQKVKKGQVLLLDFGAKYKDYCADLSRTIFIGRATDPHKNIYTHVHSAQKKAISKITAGSKAKEIYHYAKKVFKAQKLDKYFIHGLGHGIGLEVHEKPHLRPASTRQLASRRSGSSLGEPNIDETILRAWSSP